MGGTAATRNLQSGAGWFSARAVVCAGFFFLVLGCRLWVIHRFAGPTPFWDEWDGEAAMVLKPFIEGRLHFADLFVPHNEHVIVFTRLFTIGAYELAGYWDVVLQMVMNAAFYSLVQTLIVAALARGLGDRAFYLAVLASALVAAVPFAWENILFGFDTQFYVLIGLSVLALACLCRPPAWSPRWWAGSSLAVASFLSMASGALTPGAGGALHVLQSVARRRSGRREWAAIALLMAVTIGLAALIPNVAPSAPFKASGPAEFAGAFAQIVSFPMRLRWGWVAFLPAAVLLVVVLLQRRPLTDPAWLRIAVICWLLAQYAALAYGRGKAPLASRYADLFQLGTIVNVVAALSLAPVGMRLRRLRPILLWVWFAVMAVGIGTAAYVSLPDAMATRNRRSLVQTENVSRYLATGDIAALTGKALLDIPYPLPERLRMLLDDVTVRPMLPPALFGRSPPPTFVEQVKAALLAGHFIMTGAGVVLLLLGAPLLWRGGRSAITENIP